MRGPQAEPVVVAVAQPHQLGTVVVPAAALLPQVVGLQRRHQDLLRADGVHLLAHDALDLAQDHLTQRQVRVDA